MAAFEIRRHTDVTWAPRSTQHFAGAGHFPARREMARMAVGDPV
ncbi:MAG: hypothetical protein RIB98_18010 [Acidimicrobiales bacterium]